MIITGARQVGHYESGSGGTWVIEAPADFDVYSTPAVRELAVWLIDDGAAAIVFDLGGVTVMDNTGPAVIFGAHKRLRGAGRKGAAVAAAGGRVARHFEATGLSGHLPMYATAADALADWQ